MTLGLNIEDGASMLHYRSLGIPAGRGVRLVYRLCATERGRQPRDILESGLDDGRRVLAWPVLAALYRRRSLGIHPRCVRLRVVVVASVVCRIDQRHVDRRVARRGHENRNCRSGVVAMTDAVLSRRRRDRPDCRQSFVRACCGQEAQAVLRPHSYPRYRDRAVKPLHVAERRRAGRPSLPVCAGGGNSNRQAVEIDGYRFFAVRGRGRGADRVHEMVGHVTFSCDS